MLIAVALMMLMGAGATSSRYQIAGAGGTSYYILDSHTGKIVAAGGGGRGQHRHDGSTRRGAGREQVLGIMSKIQQEVGNALKILSLLPIASGIWAPHSTVRKSDPP